MRRGLSAVEFDYDAMTGAFTVNDHPSISSTPRDTSPWPTLSIPGGPVTTIDTHTGATSTTFGTPFTIDPNSPLDINNPFITTGPIWGRGRGDDGSNATNWGRYAIYAGVGLLALWVLLRK